MIISLAEEKDILSIAKIHKDEISKGFLSSLDISFLKRFYRALIKSKSSFCVVAKENSEVVGFIAGVSNMNTFYAYFLLHYFFQSFFILLPKIFSSMKKILESLLYPVRNSPPHRPFGRVSAGGVSNGVDPKKEQSLPKAELLTIAVTKEFQGKGVGSLMLPVFIAEIKKRNINIFKVVVGEKLRPAIKFYEKNNFMFVKNITIHSNALSRVYVYKI